MNAWPTTCRRAHLDTAKAYLENILAECYPSLVCSQATHQPQHSVTTHVDQTPSDGSIAFRTSTTYRGQSLLGVVASAVRTECTLGRTCHCSTPWPVQVKTGTYTPTSYPRHTGRLRQDGRQRRRHVRVGGQFCPRLHPAYPSISTPRQSPDR